MARSTAEVPVGIVSVTTIDTIDVRASRRTRPSISNGTNGGYAVSEGARYADARGTDLVSSYKYDEQSLPYMEARPKTIRETIVQQVCRMLPATPPKKP